jgi:hypothetical protein
MDYPRLLDPSHQPTDEDMAAAIGRAEGWLALRQYIEKSYDCPPEVIFGGKNYGWMVRYRKSGKTLCTLYPEQDAFTALVVLGGKDADQALSMLEEFSPRVRAVIENTEQLHDGRWLFIRVLDPDEVEDVKKLLAIKRRPRKP